MIVPALAAGAVTLAISEDGSVRSEPSRISAASVRALESGDDPAPIIARIADRGPSDSDELGARALEPRPARPTRVEIPEAGLAIEVEPMGARGDRFDLPRPHVVGWYRGGPRPGEPGRAILVGHLDTKTGPAAFARLPEAQPGQSVVIKAADASTLRYRVTDAVRVSKSTFAAASLYGPSRRPGLVLITCGGRFDQRSGHYLDNVVVLAREV